MKLKASLGALACSAAALFATAAQAAPTSCFGSAALIDQPPAVCESYGNNTSDSQIAGTPATIGSGSGSLDLLTFDGQPITLAYNNDTVLGNSGVVQYGGLNAATSYLVLIYETGGGTRDWIVVSLTGAALATGVNYVEGNRTGTVKFEIYADPGGNPTNIPEPTSAALAALGLAGVAALRRRRRT